MSLEPMVTQKSFDELNARFMHLVHVMNTLAVNGTQHDLNPTRMIRAGETQAETSQYYTKYMAGMDQRVRTVAQNALRNAQVVPATIDRANRMDQERIRHQTDNNLDANGQSRIPRNHVDFTKGIDLVELEKFG